jgi:hypothetical protein
VFTAPDASALDDSAIFATTPDALLEGVRRAATGTDLDVAVEYLLRRSGLLAASGLTDAGMALFKTAWVLRHTEVSRRSLGLALRALVPIQVLEQELLQFGAVPEEGALELLRLHRCLPPDLQLDSLRRFFRHFSPTGLLVYSSKFKTVRARSRRRMRFALVKSDDSPRWCRQRRRS